MVADSEVEHVVMLVPGIRDYAGWKKTIEAQLLNTMPDIRVHGTNIGFFNIAQFLLPFPWQRNWAYKRVHKAVREVWLRYPNAEISFIAHSFGSLCVSQLLLSEFDFTVRRLIFCGSVVPKEFPFSDKFKNFVPPILNDVGTNDPWPVFAQAVALGCGSIGTYGYGDSAYVQDRFHNGRGHNAFFEDGFAETYWAPFLQDGTVVTGSVPKDPPPVWVEAIARVPIKLFLLIAFLLVANFFLVRLFYPVQEIYASAPTATRTAVVDGREVGFYSWRSMVWQYLVSARETCPWRSNCPPTWLQNVFWGRDYRAVQFDTDLDLIGSCRPYIPEARTTDPYAAINTLSAAFPDCTSVTVTPDQFIWMPREEPDGLVAGHDRASLYCGCSPQQIEALEGGQ